MNEEIYSQEEITYYHGPWSHDLDSRWRYQTYYIGMHGWTRINRRAMWRDEPWGCYTEESA